jgi:hypothetical protein
MTSDNRAPFFQSILLGVLGLLGKGLKVQEAESKRALTGN